MKIAFINIYQGKVERGAETFVMEVAHRLFLKHQVVVFQPRKAVGEEKYTVKRISIYLNWKIKDSSGTLLRRFFLDYWSVKIFIFTLKTLASIYKEKYDIVIPLNGGWQPALIRLVTWLYGGRMVIAGQSGIGWDDRNNLWSFPDRFVALSTFGKNWAKKVNPFVEAEYIPNGVDLNKFLPKGKRLKTNLKRPIVLCVAALTKTKRVNLAIEAVAKLPNVSLLVIGDGNLRDEIRHLGKEKLGKKFELIKLNYKEIPKVYRTADIFTIPSESYYSFEIVLTEAMATNLSVVANDDPIRKEIVGDAGMLVNPADVDKYSEAINKALNTRWGKIPREQATKFSWDLVAIKYDKLFRKITK